MEEKLNFIVEDRNESFSYQQEPRALHKGMLFIKTNKFKYTSPDFVENFEKFTWGNHLG